MASRVSQPGVAMNGWGVQGQSRPLASSSYPTSEFTVQAASNLENLGMSFEYDNGFIRVSEVAPASWAQLQNITVGCIVTRLNNLTLGNRSPEALKAELQSGRAFLLTLRRSTQDLNYHHADDAMTKGLIDRTTADVHKALFQVPPGVLKMFPIVFLLFSLAMFVMPIGLVLNVGNDPTSRHWFGLITHVVLVLPILYIITYFVHVVKRAPSRVFITLSLIGSCLTLLIISNIVLMEAYVMAPMFAASSDCMSWAPKREMQAEWDSARTYYATCMNKIAVNQSITFAAAVNTYRIQECPTYNTEVELHPSWAYLEHLEATQWCGGWCKSAPAMWTNDQVQDACAPVVAQIMNDKVIWCLKQVCFYAVISLVVISAVLLSLPHVLRDYGIDWYA